jgi:ribonuclease III
LLKFIPGFSKNRSEAQLKKSLRSLLGFTPSNISLYLQAFSHSSRKQEVDNERLEFLGDAVLGAVVAEYLFKIFPYKDEGFLTQLRSKIVNRSTLQQLALKFGINQYLKTNLSHTERNKSSAYGDAFEAMIGAIYLDKGFLTCKKFIIQRIIKVHIDLDELINTDTDYKSQLQIYAQKNKLSLEYRLISERQRGKDKIFTIQVIINGKPYVSFEHYSKRIAEQKAAQLTLEELGA